jgi:hypothetical protein
VACGHLLGADLARGGQQLVKLYVIVAEGARDGRAAREIIVYEWADDGLFELAFEVDYVMREAEVLGYVARVIDVVD